MSAAPGPEPGAVSPDGELGSSPATGAITAADANRRFYADHAAGYDTFEHCASREEPRRQTAALLDRAIAAAGTDTPRTLDACGGTGNVSELLAWRGIKTTVADISPEMLAIWRRKAGSIGVEADIFEGGIDEFLAADERQWDLIVFSSALHHLDDYVGVAGLAADRIAPGGVIVTTFDPVRTGESITPRLRRFDYLLSLVLDPRALIAAIGRKRGRHPGEAGVDVSAVAELHALGGVDDIAIVECLGTAGMEIIEHSRYAEARYRLTEGMMRALRLPNTFHLIARKPEAP